MILPGRLANPLAFDLLGVEKITDAAAEPAQEEAGRRRPMPGEESRLVDHAVADLPAGKDRARVLAAPARVEIVTMEVEQHDACPLDPLEQRIEPSRIEAPRIVKLVEIAKGGRCRCHDRVHILRGIGRHQGEERTKGLAGEHHAAIALPLELTDQLDQPAGTGRQGVAVAQPIEAQDVPPRIAQHPQIRRRRRIGIFRVDRAAMVPDHCADRLIRAGQGLTKGRIEPDRSCRSASEQHNRDDKPPHRDRTLPHS